MDELTSGDPAAMEAVVSKVKSWLARKRFYAAIHAVRSINRFGRLIRGVRAMHEFRRAGRFMLSMVRVWIPAARRARVNLLQSEEYQARLAEEVRSSFGVAFFRFDFGWN